MTIQLIIRGQISISIYLDKEYNLNLRTTIFIEVRQTKKTCIQHYIA